VLELGGLAQGHRYIGQFACKSVAISRKYCASSYKKKIK